MSAVVDHLSPILLRRVRISFPRVRVYSISPLVLMYTGKALQL